MNALSMNVQILLWQYLYKLLKIHIYTLSQVTASCSLDTMYMLIGYTGAGGRGGKSVEVILTLG